MAQTLKAPLNSIFVPKQLKNGKSMASKKVEASFFLKNHVEVYSSSSLMLHFRNFQLLLMTILAHMTWDLDDSRCK